MRRRTLLLPGALVGVALALAAVTVQLWLGGRGAGQSSAAQLMFAISPLAFVAVGSAIMLARPGLRMGALMYFAGLSLALEAGTQAWARASYGGASIPAGRLAAWASEFLWTPQFGALFLLLLLFPDGRLPSHRWRPLLWAAVATPVTLMLALPWSDGPLVDYERWRSPVPRIPVLSSLPAYAEDVFLPLLPALLICCAAALVMRFVRSRGLERAQLKWLALAASIGVGSDALSYVPGLGVMNVVANASISLLPIAVGVAILRHRLYDIDRILSRTVSYAVLTGLLVAVYVGFVTVAARLVPSGSSLAVAMATLAVAALFQPLRRRVQAAVDRRFNRARFDADRTVDEFSRRLRAQVDLEAVSADLLGVVHRTLQPAGASLWLRQVSR